MSRKDVSPLGVKALLHWAVFHAICLAILLRRKLHQKLPSVRYRDSNLARNCFVAASVAENRT